MSNSDDVQALAERIDRLEHELATLRSERETALTGWPNEPTIAQGFLGHRWQRRDGDSYTENLANIPEAPFDDFYYGRHQFGWAQVVEEAPAATARRSNAGWARASYGSATTWISLDDVLFNYCTEVPVGPAAYARVRLNDGGTGWTTIETSGVPEIPATPPSAAYARTRLSGQSPTWTNFNEMRIASLDSPAFEGSPTLTPTPPTGTANALLANTEFVGRDFLGKAGGNMSGPLIAVQGGSLTNLGLAIGDNATGWYRSGNILVMSVSGAFVQQWLVDMVQMAVPIMMGGANKITSLADATAPQDALNLRTADARYLPVSGGTLTGSLTTVAGTGIRDLAIGVGEDTTGLYRQGGSLGFMVLGFPLLLLDGNNRSAAFIGPLNMSANVIANVANPGLGSDALNLQTGDARYVTLLNGGIVQGPVQLLSTPVTINDAVTKGYVDQTVANARSPTVIYDLPADVAIPGDGAWHLLAQVPFIITRTGLSRIQITLNCNMANVNNVASVGVRLIEGGVERTVFGFGVTPGGDSTGFSCNLYFDSGSGLVNIPVEVASLSLQGAPAPFTVLGGTGPRHSQIVVMDLGAAQP